MRRAARLKGAIRAVAPPVLWDAARHVRRRLAQTRGQPEWQYVGERWEPARLGASANGWQAEGVARAYRERFPAFLEAIRPPNPLSVAHEAPLEADVDRHDLSAHTALLSFAYVAALAADRRERLSVLDWGGALGHYAAVAQSVLPRVPLDYHCKETPAVCAAGRDCMPSVTFHESEACLDARYDLVVASSSLHYAERWDDLLARLAAASDSYMFVTRLPLVERSRSFLVRQRAHAYGYETEYVGWCLNRADFLAAADDTGLHLLREFPLTERIVAEGAPEPGLCRGLLFGRPPP
jgi:putative methyltransferase (TIGR04325 family)